ncbi:hypothetical protein ACUN3I_12695 [Hafnia alvei]|uniref:hypothetical protein n=1 Tax=Hafnia alvei TaxID=569 RepID=UPI004044AC30
MNTQKASQYIHEAELSEQGKKTIFEKTTNNTFTVYAGDAFDALALAIPDAYSPDGTEETSYCVHASLIGITFGRKNISDRNNAPAYGFWCQKMAVSLIKDLRFECSNFGFFWGGWSNIFESVQFLGLGIGQYCGFSLTKLRGSVYHLSGTSNVMNLVQVANYQLGFLISALQYSSMTCCTADGIFPMTGTSETIASAYTFYNPHNINMNSCAAEEVTGSQIRIAMAETSVYNGAININAYMGVIGQKNPKEKMEIIHISNAYSRKLLVSFCSGDLTLDGGLSNLTPTLINGAHTYVRTVCTSIDVPIVSDGANFLAL